MKRVRLVALLLAFLCMVPFSLLARDISPVVSTDWLAQNLTNAKLKIVDIRKLEEFKEGHIPGALNAFYGVWAVKRGNLQNELPADDDLLDLINSLGIAGDSLVVVAGKTDNPTEQVNLTRVAWTLKYAGIENVAILDGAYNKWVAEKKPLTAETVKPAPSTYKPVWNKSIVVDKTYVKKALGKAVIMDTRMPDFYFGVSKLDFVKRAGHIQGAVSLPSPWIFTKEGTFKSAGDLQAMASGTVGQDKSMEIISYCDTGRLCSGWWFALAEILGYKNVKSYDGSSEDWAADPEAPMVKYMWK